MLSRAAAALQTIPNLHISEHVPLSRYTRFEIGGAARLLVDASTPEALAHALRLIREHHWPHAVIGAGSNLVVSDQGFAGVVVRYTASAIEIDGSMVHVEAGAILQSLVDMTIDWDLSGIHTMTGIPGWVGGAIYGNAGAYGHSIHEFVENVRFFDGHHFQDIGNDAGEFSYRESIFKRRKDWVIVSVTLGLGRGEKKMLHARAEEILKIRSQKYPPTMRCAGSIFKNLLLGDLSNSVRAQVPERVIREGKVPSAYFLEQAGAKGLVNGGIRVADYHANLIYNAGGGTAAQVRELIELLKRRVNERFGLALEEEVQFV